MQTETGVVYTNGAELPYEAYGEGPALLLIHAGVADRHMWDAQVAAFSPHFRVIRYDVRGMGHSKTESVEYSSRADILAVLEHVGVEKAHVLGLSMGGYTAIDFALEYPERVLSLIPVAAGVSGLDEDLLPQELEHFMGMDEIYKSGNLERLNELEIDVWFAGFHRKPEDMDPKLRDMMLEMNRLNLIRIDGQATPIRLDPPAIGRLHEIKVPTLVIWGDIDVSGTVQACKLIAETIPNAQQHVFEGVAHMVNLERPDEFNQLVLNFLKAV